MFTTPLANRGTSQGPNWPPFTEYFFFGCLRPAPSIGCVLLGLVIPYTVGGRMMARRCIDISLPFVARHVRHPPEEALTPEKLHHFSCLGWIPGLHIQICLVLAEEQTVNMKAASRHGAFATQTPVSVTHIEHLPALTIELFALPATNRIR